MINEEETAAIILKLIGKNNWGAKYDRTEHFKRFPNLKKIIKELQRADWLILKKKSNYLGISLNPKCRKEIYDFLTQQIKGKDEGGSGRVL